MNTLKGIVSIEEFKDATTAILSYPGQYWELHAPAEIFQAIRRSGQTDCLLIQGQLCWKPAFHVEDCWLYTVFKRQPFSLQASQLSPVPKPQEPDLPWYRCSCYNGITIQSADGHKAGAYFCHHNFTCEFHGHVQNTRAIGTGLWEVKMLAARNPVPVIFYWPDQPEIGCEQIWRLRLVTLIIDRPPGETITLFHTFIPDPLNHGSKFTLTLARYQVYLD